MELSLSDKEANNLATALFRRINWGDKDIPLDMMIDIQEVYVKLAQNGHRARNDVPWWDGQVN